MEGLNKEVCKRCLTQSIKTALGEERPLWLPGDDRRWDEDGVVFCAVAGAEIDVNGPPPKGCAEIDLQVLSSQRVAEPVPEPEWDM